jgi:hypothetical protein
MWFEGFAVFMIVVALTMTLSGAVLAGFVAARLDRSAVAWFIIACLVSPLLALIALNALGRPRKPLELEMEDRNEAALTT